MESIKTGYIANDYAEFWVADGILYNVYKPGLKHMTLEVAKAILDTRHKLTRPKSLPVLVDTSTTIKADADARKYLANPYAMEGLTACAIIVRSPIIKLAANLYNLVDRLTIPIRIFTSWPEAVKWLEKFKM